MWVKFNLQDWMSDTQTNQTEEILIKINDNIAHKYIKVTYMQYNDKVASK